MNLETLAALALRLKDTVRNSLAVVITDYEGLVLYSSAPTMENVDLIAVFVRDIVNALQRIIHLFGTQKLNTVVIRIDSYAFHIFPLEKVIGIIIAKREEKTKS